MTYTVWLHGQKIGESHFERQSGQKRLGVFYATAFGLTMLPSITDLLPALTAFGDMCRRQHIDVDDSRPESALRALDRFAETPEGCRVIAAATRVGELVVKDARDRPVAWDSMLITNVEDLRTVEPRADCQAQSEQPAAWLASPFTISMTLARRRVSQGSPHESRRPQPITAVLES